MVCFFFLFFTKPIPRVEVKVCCLFRCPPARVLVDYWKGPEAVTSWGSRMETRESRISGVNWDESTYGGIGSLLINLL